MLWFSCGFGLLSFMVVCMIVCSWVFDLCCWFRWLFVGWFGFVGLCRLVLVVVMFGGFGVSLVSLRFSVFVF